jgi:hypothetical protein
MRRARCLWCWISVSPMNASGSSPDPGLNGNLHYPNDIDRSLNEAAADKIRKYRADYNNNPPDAVSFFCLLLLVRLGGYIVNSLDCYSYRLIGKLTAFLQLQELACATKQWTLPLPPRGVLCAAKSKSRLHPRQGCSFEC